MKGYRTIIFSALMTLAGMIGWKVSPEAASQWVDVFVSFWGIGAIILRQITTTPVGSSGAVVAASLSEDSLAALQADLQTILGHVSITPALARATGNIADKFDLVLGAIQAVAAANAAPTAPALAPAPAPAPVSGSVLDAPADPAPADPAPTPQIVTPPAAPLITPAS